MAATPQLKRLHLASPGRDHDEAELREAILAKLSYAVGKTRDAATDADWYQATVLAVRDRVKKKTVRLTAGKSYLARPPKP